MTECVDIRIWYFIGKTAHYRLMSLSKTKESEIDLGSSLGNMSLYFGSAWWSLWNKLAVRCVLPKLTEHPDCREIILHSSEACWGIFDCASFWNWVFSAELPHGLAASAEGPWRFTVSKIHKEHPTEWTTLPGNIIVCKRHGIIIHYIGRNCLKLVLRPVTPETTLYVALEE